MSANTAILATRIEAAIVDARADGCSAADVIVALAFVSTCFADGVRGGAAIVGADIDVDALIALGTRLGHERAAAFNDARARQASDLAAAAIDKARR